MIAGLDDDEYVQAAAQAEAELAVRQAARDQAASTLELAEREHQRAQALRERGIASESQLDEIEATLKRSRAALAFADAQVKQAEASLELARIRLGYTLVRASWSGPEQTALVSERFQDPGNTVQPGDAIVSVVVLDPLVAVVSVTEP